MASKISPGRVSNEVCGMVLEGCIDGMTVFRVHMPMRTSYSHTLEVVARAGERMWFVIFGARGLHSTWIERLIEDLLQNLMF